MAVPFLYYGAQLIAIPFFPQYHWISMVASVLGSSSAPLPWIWNDAMILAGVVTIVAAAGFYLGLRSLGVGRSLAAVISIATIASGIVSIAGGLYHLGDERHGGGPFILGWLVLPALFAVALWRHGPPPRLLPLYLIASTIALIALLPLYARAQSLGLADVEGLLQRLLTLTVYPCIGISAWRIRCLLSTPRP
jgi:hypothetical protein